MYTQNTCLYVPFHKDYNSIHTVNMVLETNPQFSDKLLSESVYKMYLVCSGNGLVHTLGNIRFLTIGDVFFSFPGVPFRIQFEKDFTYMYIGFLGSRGNMIMEKLGISSNNFLFHNCNEIIPLWEQGLKSNSELADLMSESILLYTFTFLGNRMLNYNKSVTAGDDTVFVIKKYIDDNFSRPEFTLEEMSKQLVYNPKYISAIFKRKMNIGVNKYLNTIRIQNACTMIHQGFTSINDISFRCGYNDPQYFSKVFKKSMGQSPSAYIRNVKQSMES